ncbi:hypothetical protein KJA14_02035 [Patescibacteria group bacterium]|nr:hypothetical protein [Patescibacteria group bacterium]
MGILDRFRKKKKEEKTEEEVTEIITDLEKLCGDDKEVYEALLNTMFLDPRKIGTSMGEAAKKAKKFEKSGDTVRARMWYEIAGGLAIYHDNVAKVRKYFGKCEELSNEKYPILKIPGKAVKKAQEYYPKYLKAEEKK